ncbi:GTP cyclohydrolase 1 type 2/Nif3, partial [Mycena latifolia]
LATPTLLCAAAGISVYSPHSALDGVFGGMNHAWARICTRRRPRPRRSVRVTFAPPISMGVLEGRIKKNFSLSQGWSYSPRFLPPVAICAGSGGSMFSAMGTTADMWFTGEMEHHEVLAEVAADRTVRASPNFEICAHLITGGHTNTERGHPP